MSQTEVSRPGSRRLSKVAVVGLVTLGMVLTLVAVAVVWLVVRLIPQQTYSCSAEGLERIGALESLMADATTWVSPPVGADDCDSSGKAGVQGYSNASTQDVAREVGRAFTCSRQDSKGATVRLACSAQGLTFAVAVSHDGYYETSVLARLVEQG